MGFLNPKKDISNMEYLSFYFKATKGDFMEETLLVGLVNLIDGRA